MPSVINQIKDAVWSLISDLFKTDQFEYGTMTLQYDGERRKTIFVETKTRPSKIYFNMISPTDAKFVCGGGDNCYISEPVITDAGFHFTVVINGQSTRIEWFCPL